MKRIETHLSLRRLQQYLEKRNIQLRHEIEERMRAEEYLRKHEIRLEELVAERTTDLQQEIRERRRAEETLKENAHFLQTLMDAIPNPIYYKDICGVYQGCNAAFESYIGQDKSMIVGKSVYDVAPKELADQYHEMDMTLLHQGGVQVYESSVRYANGSMHDVIFNKATYTNAGGTLGGLVGVILDITERKQAEVVISEANERFRTLVNTIPDLIWLKNADGVYLSCNKMFERFFGAREADIVGKTDYDFVDMELANLFREYDRRAMAAGGPISNEEWITFADDGHRALLETTKTPMHDTEGVLIGVLGVGRDITERKRAEEELSRYREHLEVLVKERTVQLEVAMTDLSLARDAANAANQAKSMFLANMSHEIRTPMNAVLGFAQLLERDATLSPQARNRVATILQSGEHLLSIINDILEMSRIEAGRVQLRSQSIDLTGLLDDLSAMFRSRAEAKGLTFSTAVAPGLSRYIVADLGKLRQVLINLLGNAVKFTKAGSIVLRAFSAGLDRIAIEVRDTGIGISPAEQDKLFRPFERTISGEQTAGGTGLGLAISREYAHLMGGDIQAESVEGAGSSFRFEFHAPASTEAPVVAQTRQRVMGLSPGQGEIHVLVVDDQSNNRELLRCMLAPLGFIIDEASDGEEAVKKTQELKPRIILMDLVMPGMDGIEATRILRTTCSKESLVIIGITASAFEMQKEQFLDAGVNAFISKPFRDQLLYDVLAAHAGVSFETEENEGGACIRPSEGIPSLNSMPAEWCEAFKEALNRKNITRIRRLGEAAKKYDQVLSFWLLERVGLYDMEGLKKLRDNHERRNDHE